MLVKLMLKNNGGQEKLQTEDVNKNYTAICNI